MEPALPYILIVEDQPDSRLFLQEYLEWQGYRIVATPSAEQGLALARDLPPAIVLMDMTLPGMDGLEATRVLRVMPGCQQVPVLALTAHTGRSFEGACIEAGCNAVLSKPFEPDVLLAYIRRLTALHPRSDASSGA